MTFTKNARRGSLTNKKDCSVKCGSGVSGRRISFVLPVPCCAKARPDQAPSIAWKDWSLPLIHAWLFPARAGTESGAAVPPATQRSLEERILWVQETESLVWEIVRPHAHDLMDQWSRQKIFFFFSGFNKKLVIFFFFLAHKKVSYRIGCLGVFQARLVGNLLTLLSLISVCLFIPFAQFILKNHITKTKCLEMRFDEGWARRRSFK